MFFNTDHFWAFYWYVTENFGDECWEEITDGIWFF